jgi:hypothetical protein
MIFKTNIFCINYLKINNFGIYIWRVGNFSAGCKCEGDQVPRTTLSYSDRSEEGSRDLTRTCLEYSLEGRCPSTKGYHVFPPDAPDPDPLYSHLSWQRKCFQKFANLPMSTLFLKNNIDVPHKWANIFVYFVKLFDIVYNLYLHISVEYRLPIFCILSLLKSSLSCAFIFHS